MGGRTGWKNWINAGARLVLLAAGVYGCLLLLRSSDGIACSPWAVYGGDGRTVSAPVAFRRQGKRLCAGSVGTAPSGIRGGPVQGASGIGPGVGHLGDPLCPGK